MFQSSNELVFRGFEVKKGTSNKSGSPKSYEIKLVRFFDPVLMEKMEFITNNDYSQIPVGTKVIVGLTCLMVGFNTRVYCSDVSVIL